MIWHRTLFKLGGADVAAVDTRQELTRQEHAALESRLRIVYDLLIDRGIHARLVQLGPIYNLAPEPSDRPAERTDRAALDKLNLLLSAPTWPGASALEDVCAIVRSTGRSEVPDAPAWEGH
jgi:hypothetical protein